ncbi:acetyl-CoA acyltransferase [Leucobacter luti]|uniref:thiolase family protein n=1 Tax=Leucobacter luti TaxID=340320 RepID=UPI001048A9D2|nr:thiolase family protein [Leucobacter luti]MCW2287831.1 acetyl-CoA acyltransferase [Leucobacter luti]TCK46006.1 acetyl-CoA acyltransferase [Leucobacter luti]
MAAMRDVVFVDGVRTPFGRAGDKGMYAGTRADDLAVKALQGLLARNERLPLDRIDDVGIAATTQQGDQGLTLGRTVSILSGIPVTVPGFALDRMCAGALTVASFMGAAIGSGQYDIAVAGGVEHMGRHPLGLDADPNPRFVAEKLVSPDALNMGLTAERLHDRFPALTKERADRFGMLSQHKVQAAYDRGDIQPDLIPVATRSADGWGLATEDEGRRPQTTMEGLAGLKTPFRPHGRVTAGTSSPLTDGATMSLMAGADTARELGLTAKMRLVGFAFAGVEPEVMGLGPVPATEKALKRAGLSITDIGLFELNEAFAVQVLSFTDHFGISDEDPRVNPWGGAIAVGHPLAASGVRLMIQLARQFEQRPDVRYGVTAMCVGLGQGGTAIWENPHFDGKKGK